MINTNLYHYSFGLDKWWRMPRSSRAHHI